MPLSFTLAYISGGNGAISGSLYFLMAEDRTMMDWNGFFPLRLRNPGKKCPHRCKSGVYQIRTHPFTIQVTWTTMDTLGSEKHPHSDPGQKTAQWGLKVNDWGQSIHFLLTFFNQFSNVTILVENHLKKSGVGIWSWRFFWGVES